jgi:hypothetical protein
MRAWHGARAPVLRPYAGARAGWDAGAGHGAMRCGRRCCLREAECWHEMGSGWGVGCDAGGAWDVHLDAPSIQTSGR